MATTSNRIRTVILGAAGRDFHNFNCLFRDDPTREVVAFTATQIPDIEGRRYPAELAGDLYPDGIPIRGEDELEALIRKEGVSEAWFSYSDIAQPNEDQNRGDDHRPQSTAAILS